MDPVLTPVDLPDDHQAKIKIRTCLIIVVSMILIMLPGVVVIIVLVKGTLVVIAITTPIKKSSNRQYAPVYLTGIAHQLTHTILFLRLITTVVMPRSKRYTERSWQQSIDC